jgi:hypothetical protein
MVVSTRYRPLYENAFAKAYAAVRELGLPAGLLLLLQLG